MNVVLSEYFDWSIQTKGAITSDDEEKYQFSSASALNYFHLPMTRLCVVLKHSANFSFLALNSSFLSRTTILSLITALHQNMLLYGIMLQNMESTKSYIAFTDNQRTFS